MNYIEWKEDFLKNNDITSMSIDDIMKFAFNAGAEYVEENTPLVAKDIETGELSIISREKDLPSNIPTISDDDDFDFGKHLKNNKKHKKLNKNFVRNNLIDVVFATRYSYGTDIHMGCTLETTPIFEEMISMFIEFSKSEKVSEEEELKFKKIKEELFGLIFSHICQEDNYYMDKMNLENAIENLKFEREFLNKKEKIVYHPLVENVVEGFDD